MSENPNSTNYREVFLSLLGIEESLLQQYRAISVGLNSIGLPLVASILESNPSLAILFTLFGIFVTKKLQSIQKERGVYASYFRVQLLALEYPKKLDDSNLVNSLSLKLPSTCPLYDFKTWQYSEVCTAQKAQEIKDYYDEFLGKNHHSCRRIFFDDLLPVLLSLGYLAIFVQALMYSMIQYG